MTVLAVIDVGLTPAATVLAEVVHHQIGGLIIRGNDDGSDPGEALRNLAAAERLCPKLRPHIGHVGTFRNAPH